MIGGESLVVFDPNQLPAKTKGTLVMRMANVTRMTYTSDMVIL